MEFFNKTKVVELRSHLDKYLVADDDQKTVRQSRNGSLRKARWLVEPVEGNGHVIRLKSCHGRYLTASHVSFFLGITGKKVLQTVPEKIRDWSIEWEPVREGFQVKLRSRRGKWLRGNGGTPPWRNSITHDNPRGTSTKNCVLWNVEAVQVPESESLTDYLSMASGFSSVSDELSCSEPASPMSVVSTKSPRILFANKNGMEFFHNAKVVCLRSHHDKYLLAEEDEETVTQDRNSSSRTARWTVEFVQGSHNIIRLKSCYAKYLTASDQPFLLGMTGRKVLQTQPRRLDSSVEWEPIREGAQVKLKTRYGNFLRANGGVPPWRNSVTHDVPHRTATQDWVLWDVDIVETQIQSPAPIPIQYDSGTSEFSSTTSSPSIKSTTFSVQESSDSCVSTPRKSGGRTIHYQIVDEMGGVDDDGVEGISFSFKGNGVDELTRRLEEETGLQDIIVCSRSPLNGKLCPLRLQLPPNTTTMRVVVVQSSSEEALPLVKGKTTRSLKKQSSIEAKEQNQPKRKRVKTVGRKTVLSSNIDLQNKRKLIILDESEEESEEDIDKATIQELFKMRKAKKNKKKKKENGKKEIERKKIEERKKQEEKRRKKEEEEEEEKRRAEEEQQNFPTLQEVFKNETSILPPVSVNKGNPSAITIMTGETESLPISDETDFIFADLDQLLSASSSAAFETVSEDPIGEVAKAQEVFRKLFSLSFKELIHHGRKQEFEAAVTVLCNAKVFTPSQQQYLQEANIKLFTFYDLYTSAENEAFSCAKKISERKTLAEFLQKSNEEYKCIRSSELAMDQKIKKLEVELQAVRNERLKISQKKAALGEATKEKKQSFVKTILEAVAVEEQIQEHEKTMAVVQTDWEGFKNHFI